MRISKPLHILKQTIFIFLLLSGLTEFLYAQKVYWTVPLTPGTIRRANLDGTQNELLLQADVSTSNWGIDFNPYTNQIYWVGRNKLKRAVLTNGSNQETLATLTSNVAPRALKLDLLNSKVYWVEQLIGDRIAKANLDGTSLETVIDGNTLSSSSVFTISEGLAIDENAGKMYFTASFAPSTVGSKIYRSNLDGTGLEILITFPIGLRFMGFIDLDLINNKIFWTDSEGLHKANLDGTSMQTLVSQDLYGSDLFVDAGNNKLYWTDGSKLYSSELNGANQTHISLGTGLAWGLVIDTRTTHPNALNFDGVNDYADLGNLHEGFSEMTMEAWVRPTAITGTSQVCSKNFISSMALIPDAGQGKLQMQLGDGTAWSGTWTSNNQIPLNTWTHIATTWDGNTIKLYLNGNLDSEYSFTGTVGTNANNRLLGNAYVGASEYFKGDMDEMRLWNVARTCSQIKEKMQHELVCTETGLYAYYTFNHGVPNGSNSFINETYLNNLMGLDDPTLHNFIFAGSTSNWVDASANGVLDWNSTPQPEIEIQGNATIITNGDNTPSATDHTDFGEVSIGTPITRTFTVHNLGQGDLSLSGTPLVTLSNSNDFSISTQPTSSTVTGSGSITFEVTFNPNSTGIQNNTISITNDDCDEAIFTFDITAEAREAEIEIVGNGAVINDGDTSPDIADDTDFGTITLGGSISHTFTISNTNTGTLNLTGTPLVELSNTTDFTVSTLPTSPVAGNSSTTFEIIFSPLFSGLKTSTVTILNNDSDEGIFTFTIQGNSTFIMPEIPATQESIYLNGTDAYAQTTNTVANFAGNEAFSLMFWLKVQTMNNTTLIHKPADLTGNLDIELLLQNDGSLVFNTGKEGAGIDTKQSSTNLLEPKKWYHITITSDGLGNKKLFLNALEETLTGADNIDYLTAGSATSSYFIGTDATQSTFANIQIEDFKIFNNTRTIVEIESDMVDTNLPFSPDLVAYWAFEEDAGATSTDLLTGELLTFQGEVLQTYRVININSSGIGSLREAITWADSDSDKDYIDFSIVGTGIHTISGFTSPSITRPIVIDGYSQYGSKVNTNSLKDGSNAIINIEVTHTSGTGFSINNLASTAELIVKGLSIYDYTHGFIIGNGKLIVQGCFIGTDATGLNIKSTFNAIVIHRGTGHQIGGDLPEHRNLISGSNRGIFFGSLFSDNTKIQGNYIGTDITGMNLLSNGVGILLNNTNNNTIGGTNINEKNVIVGNSSQAIRIQNSDNNTVQGNYIGLLPNGSTPAGNGTDGIWISTNSINNIIGGVNPSEGNVIANNGSSGINISGSTNLNNTIRYNQIYNNIIGGISLNSGANNNKQAPIILTASTSQITGTCATCADGDIIDVYSDDTGTIPLQGKTHIGETTVSGGNWTLNGTFTAGDNITATATDVAPNGNTSEFSSAFMGLPIELLTFEAKKQGNNALLTWTTAMEKDNDYFVLEHSKDGQIFQEIGKVNSKGNSIELQSYSFVHDSPMSEDNYYRLKQVDLDDSYTYSEIIHLNFEGTIRNIAIYPNPSNAEVNIVIPNLSKNSKPTFRCLNVIGQSVIMNITPVTDNHWKMNTSNFKDGQYYLEVFVNQKKQVLRFIVSH